MTISPLLTALSMRNLAFALRKCTVLPDQAADILVDLAAQVEAIDKREYLYLLSVEDACMMLGSTDQMAAWWTR